MTFLPATTWRAALGAALLLLGGNFLPESAAHAGMVGVSPLRIHFDGDAQSGVVRIQNTGEADIAMQVEALRWLQSPDGDDEYEPTEDVLAVPPIFSLAPGEIQLVRVGLLAGQPADAEATYRLLFSELPAPLDDASGGQLRMRLRISMPVFVAPVAAPTPELELIDARVDGNGLRASFKNAGNTHVRIEELSALGRDGEQLERRDQAFYLLPGTTREFFIASAAGEPIARLRAVTDTAGTREYEVGTP